MPGNWVFKMPIREVLTRLKAAGLRLSLDDFGTGFSSLNLLRQLPLDALKIDKSFVDDLPANEQAMLLVSKIIEIANGLNIEVVAEGVESMAQLRALANMGCSHAQGFLISKPKQASDVMQSIEAGIGPTDLSGCVDRSAVETVPQRVPCIR